MLFCDGSIYYGLRGFRNSLLFPIFANGAVFVPQRANSTSAVNLSIKFSFVILNSHRSAVLLSIKYYLVQNFVLGAIYHGFVSYLQLT